MEQKLQAAVDGGTLRLNIGGIPHGYQAVIFDFDGVIMDTERYHYLAWNEAAAEFGLRFSEEEYFPLRSTGRPYIASVLEKKRKKAFSEEERERLFANKQAAYEALIAGLSERDFIGGAVEFLRLLSGAGMRTAIASSGTLSSVMVARYSLERYFTAILGASDALAKKPAPDIFLAAAERLHVPARECLVFEDSPAGIEAAGAAGMEAIAVGGLKTDACILCIRDFYPVLSAFQPTGPG